MVCTLPLSPSGEDRTPWQPTSIARHSHPLESLRCRKGLLVTQVWHHFPSAFASIPCVVFQPRGILSVGVSHTTLLSIAIAVVIRRHPRYACYPCLSRWRQNPLAAYLLRQVPTAMDWGVQAFPQRLLAPGKRLSPHGSQSRMGLSACFESVAVPRRLRSVCDPCCYGATEPPDRHLPASGTQHL